MKLKSTFRAKVVTSEGTFFCVFKKQKRNEALRDIYELEGLDELIESANTVDEKVELTKKRTGIISNNLIAVEDLQLEDGTEVTPQMIKDMDLYSDILNDIYKAWSAKVSGEEEDQKNEESGAQ